MQRRKEIFFFCRDNKTDLKRVGENFLNDFVLLFLDLCWWNILFVLDMNLGDE